MEIAGLNKVKHWVKQNRIATLRPKTKTASEAGATEKPKEKKLNDHQIPTTKSFLQKLLAKAESPVQRAELSKKRWQLLSLISLMFLATTLYAAIWVNIELNGLTEKHGKLNMEKHALSEQLYTASNNIENLTNQLKLLQNQNNKLAAENAILRTQSSSLSIKVKSPNTSTNDTLLNYVKDQPFTIQQKPPQTKKEQYNQSRLVDIRNGFYPEDMTKAELIAALGEPDRIYKTEPYEQLVYFDHSPSRFWFKNSPYLHASN